jgi:hypothetical protein
MFRTRIANGSILRGIAGQLNRPSEKRVWRERERAA